MVVHKELGVMNSFTLEASFAGANRGVGAQCHFNTLDLDEAWKSGFFKSVRFDLCSEQNTLHRAFVFAVTEITVKIVLSPTLDILPPDCF